MMTLKIEGATCEGCKKSILKAMNSVPGIAGAEFSLDTKIATFSGSNKVSQVVEAIELAGFDVLDASA